MNEDDQGQQVKCVLNDEHDHSRRRFGHRSQGIPVNQVSESYDQIKSDRPPAQLGQAAVEVEDGAGVGRQGLAGPCLPCIAGGDLLAPARAARDLPVGSVPAARGDAGEKQLEALVIRLVIPGQPTCHLLVDGMQCADSPAAG